MQFIVGFVVLVTCGLGGGPVGHLTLHGRPIPRRSFCGVVPADRCHRPISADGGRSWIIANTELVLVNFLKKD